MMPRRCRRTVVSSVIALLFVAIPSRPGTAGPAAARTELEGDVFTPLQSYVTGEIEGDHVFLCGLSGMGMHGLGQGRPAFPDEHFNREVILYTPDTGTVRRSGIAHLDPDLQTRLTVTNAAAVQYGDHLHIHGGYGPVDDERLLATHSRVIVVDLAAVRAALRADEVVPASAFEVLVSPASKVAGAAIQRFGPYYALVGGSNFTGDYGFAPTFSNVYAKRILLFDSRVSHVEPVREFHHRKLRRRDLNLSPITLGTALAPRPALTVHTGVFKPESFLPWEHPIVYDLLRDTVTLDADFRQMMNQYEAPRASFWSATTGRNWLLTLGGLSGSNWDGEAFVENPLVPWVTDITRIEVDADGRHADETVIGQTDKPITNAELILAPDLPVNAIGQILWDELPAGEVRIGTIHGGIEAMFPANSVPTVASPRLYGVYVTVDEPRLAVENLRAGGDAVVRVTGVEPGVMIRIGSSRSGRGFTDVPRLGVTLGLDAPIDVLAEANADPFGEAEIILPVPNEAAGTSIALQVVAGEAGSAETSNVVTAVIE